MIEVNRLKPGDETLAAEILQTFFLESHHDFVDTFLKNTLNYLLVAYWEKVAVGVLLGYELQRPETTQPMFFVYEMEVLEAQRGRGIGKALIDNFKVYCKEQNASQLFLVTNRSNIPAMRLYASTGGVQEGEDNVLFVYENFDEL